MRSRARTRGRALVAALALAAAGCGSPVAPPDVILLSVDTLNPGALSDPAAPETPAIDALAARSVRFRNAYSSSGWTLPATATLLTGLYPDRHALHHANSVSDAPFLAERLARAGYQTVAFTDGGNVHATYLEAGFERYDDRRAGASDPAPDLPRGGRWAEPRGAQLFDRAIALLARRSRDRPLFLFLQTFVVHDYFKVHPWAVAVAGPFEDRRAYGRCLRGREACSPAEQERLRALYHAELPNLDAGLARLEAAVRDHEGPGGTILVFASDHGEGLDFGGGRLHHGGRLHRDLLRVSLLVSGPRVVPRAVDDPVSLVDVAATILELAGQRVPPRLDGQSLARVVREPAARPVPRPLFAMDHRFWWRDGARHGVEEAQALPLQVAVIDGDDWYIRGRVPEAEAWTREELYDRSGDPAQTRDLSASSGRLPALRDLADRRLRQHSQRPPPQRQGPLEPELVEQLRSLGYAE